MELYAFNFVYLQWQSEEEHTETQKHKAILILSTPAAGWQSDFKLRSDASVQ